MGCGFGIFVGEHLVTREYLTEIYLNRDKHRLIA